MFKFEEPLPKTLGKVGGYSLLVGVDVEGRGRCVLGSLAEGVPESATAVIIPFIVVAEVVAIDDDDVNNDDAKLLCRKGLAGGVHEEEPFPAEPDPDDDDVDRFEGRGINRNFAYSDRVRIHRIDLSWSPASSKRSSSSLVMSVT